MALNSVVGQALSRNKAHEKVDLWKEREVQDKGSRCTISLKSKKGDVVRQVTKVPEGAEVTSNYTNQFDLEREENAARKEDMLLNRISNGKDPAWRPDLFFTEMKGEGDLPWKVRPQDCMGMDANLMQKIVAAYKASKKQDKKAKKDKKGKKKDKKGKKGKRKKEKKNKKDKKDKKDKRMSKKDKKHSEKHGMGEPSKEDASAEKSQDAKLEATKRKAKTSYITTTEAADAEARASQLAARLREQVRTSQGSMLPSPSTGTEASSCASSESSSSGEEDAEEENGNKDADEEDEEDEEDEVDWGSADEEETARKRK
eukprot:TRINITY_DN4541_c0_g1_i1.p1 TRINITY_DN4541_c0_g1~~TRINITY_DN4541_c0_g1_i1.p1  ORF type:complete len:315 (+),score=106.42 TRINITY_DN4541_c0_g1_i1:93-1037(+)